MLPFCFFWSNKVQYSPFRKADISPVFPTELTFSWIFNEYPSFVKQDTRRFVSQKTGNLYIAKVEPSDVGNYTCVVTNTVTQTTVQGPPTPLVLRSDGDVPSWIYIIKWCCVVVNILMWNYAFVFQASWVNMSQKLKFSSQRSWLLLRG